MKKYILTVVIIVGLVFLFDLLVLQGGFYIDFNPDAEITSQTGTDDKTIYLQDSDGIHPFEIKGVNLGSGYPAHWATDHAITKETYLRWFKEMKELGANTIRVYTIQSPAFYQAFYEYNAGNPDPLYLIHGVWINDYSQNSHMDAFDDGYFGQFVRDGKATVDVIHGFKHLAAGSVDSAGNGFYFWDISPWVIGYILGVEWEDVTVAYTNEIYKYNEQYTSYSGTYLYTEDASPFEVMLAHAGDEIISYESQRYKVQRLVAFSNWPTTDPFDYPEHITSYYRKSAKVDVEHIKTTPAFKSGQFASYHIYPYYPDYFTFMDTWESYGISDMSAFLTDEGNLNTYKAYLYAVCAHHSMPVVVSEFGVPSSRGMAQKDINTNRNQGYMSEEEQGNALVSCYTDIMSAGAAGGCVFSWADEWFKRTWNTMSAVDLKRTAYWSDYQTNEQYFGLLSYDPGKEVSVCYVDGDVSEWSDNDIVTTLDDGSTLSMKYDEKFIYLRLYQEHPTFGNEVIYIPIDTIQSTGSSYSLSPSVSFDRNADFLIVLDGTDNSRVLVQERYEVLRAKYSQDVYGFNSYLAENTPAADSPLFVNINLILQYSLRLINEDHAEIYETGSLRYGNANPKAEDFCSLADFCCSKNNIEIKLPWQLLNFADASRMQILDDYYKNNGIEFSPLSTMYLGFGNGSETIHLAPIHLNGWNMTPTFHERLKQSYYILQKFWTEEKE